MKVVEHHSVEQLRVLFLQESRARIAQWIWIVWLARLGKTEPEITAGSGLENLCHYFRSHCWSNWSYQDYDDLSRSPQPPGANTRACPN